MAGTVKDRASLFPFAFAVTVGLFSFWGLMHALYGIVVPQFTKFLALDRTQSMLANMAYPVTYFVLAIPVALFLRRFGYKLGIMLGLCAYSLGSFMLFPAVSNAQSIYFVSSIIITAAGWAFLETAANPLIVQMGPPETAVRRLNLAQALYPVGACIPGYLSRWVTVPQLVTADPRIVDVVVRPYVLIGLALLLLVLVIEYLDFPEAARAGVAPRTRARDEFRALLGRSEFLFAMTAMFCFIVALVCMLSVVAPYARGAVPGLGVSPADLPLYLWTAIGIGRFAGAALMYRYDPARLLVISAGICLVLCAGAAVVISQFGLVCVFGIAVFSSIMFPTVFGLAVKNLGPLTKSASGLLVAAAGFGGIAGGLLLRAFLAPSTVSAVLILAGLCFAGVLAFAVVHRRADATHGQAPALQAAE